jgi:hypothetical protein
MSVPFNGGGGGAGDYFVEVTKHLDPKYDREKILVRYVVNCIA